MSFQFPGVIGDSPRMQEVMHLLQLVAPSEATVRLLGETGTGKELAALAIHTNSPRRTGPFVVVNCAALPESLLESELFGHERGAFTGATSKKEGRFSLAHKGTLFMDEVGELPPAVQVKLLRVIQTRDVEPLGSTRTIKVDVRLIAATNRDLEAMVREGGFREDLFYRLNVFPITLPPLRERVEDLPWLAEFFLRRFRDKYQRPVKGLAPEVLEAFHRYPWPGNIRELENVMERAMIMCQGDLLTLEVLPLVLQRHGYPPGAAGDEELSLPELERQLIIRTLEKLGKNREETAKVLDISLEELNLKMRSYGLN